MTVISDVKRGLRDFLDVAEAQGIDISLNQIDVLAGAVIFCSPTCHLYTVEQVKGALLDIRAPESIHRNYLTESGYGTLSITRMADPKPEPDPEEDPEP